MHRHIRHTAALFATALSATAPIATTAFAQQPPTQPPRSAPSRGTPNSTAAPTAPNGTMGRRGSAGAMRGAGAMMGSGPAGMLIGMKTQLELTDDQLKRLETLRNVPHAKANESDMLRARADMMDASQGDGDLTKMRAALDRLSKLRNDQQIARFKERQDVRAVLTSAQKAKLDNMRGQMRGMARGIKMKRMRQRGGAGMGFGRGQQMRQRWGPGMGGDMSPPGMRGGMSPNGAGMRPMRGRGGEGDDLAPDRHPAAPPTPSADSLIHP